MVSIYIYLVEDCYILIWGYFFAAFEKGSASSSTKRTLKEEPVAKAKKKFIEWVPNTSSPFIQWLCGGVHAFMCVYNCTCHCHQLWSLFFFTLLRLSQYSILLLPPLLLPSLHLVLHPLRFLVAFYCFGSLSICYYAMKFVACFLLEDLQPFTHTVCFPAVTFVTVHDYWGLGFLDSWVL